MQMMHENNSELICFRKQHRQYFSFTKDDELNMQMYWW